MQRGTNQVLLQYSVSPLTNAARHECKRITFVPDRPGWTHITKKFLIIRPIHRRIQEFAIGGRSLPFPFFSLLLALFPLSSLSLLLEV